MIQLNFCHISLPHVFCLMDNPWNAHEICVARLYNYEWSLWRSIYWFLCFWRSCFEYKSFLVQRPHLTALMPCHTATNLENDDLWCFSRNILFSITYRCQVGFRFTRGGRFNILNIITQEFRLYYKKWADIFMEISGNHLGTFYKLDRHTIMKNSTVIMQVHGHWLSFPKISCQLK